MEEMQPGQVVSPRTASPDPSTAVAPNGGPVPERPAELPQPVAPNPSPQPEPQDAGLYSASQAAPAEPTWQPQPAPTFSQSPPPAVEVAESQLEWTGAEFVAHDKTAGWYGAIVAAGLFGAGLIYLITKDVTTTVIVVMTVIAFAAFAARKPREQRYALDETGLHVGIRNYAFHDFKSFSIADEGSVASVVLMPLKRFMPPLTIYVPLENERAVTDYIAQFLPFEQHKADAVDTLLRRIRF